MIISKFHLTGKIISKQQQQQQESMNSFESLEYVLRYIFFYMKRWLSEWSELSLCFDDTNGSRMLNVCAYFKWFLYIKNIDFTSYLHTKYIRFMFIFTNSLLLSSREYWNSPQGMFVFIIIFECMIIFIIYLKIHREIATFCVNVI